MQAEPEIVEEERDPYVIDGWDARASAPGVPERTLRAARVVAEALFATEEGPPPEERIDWMLRDVADFCGHISLRARLLFRACLAAVYWLAPLFLFELPPLSRLSWEMRVRALERMEGSILSMPFLGAKAILSIVYYEHPDAAREIGWDQQPKVPRE